jgi:hypothetical protein
MQKETRDDTDDKLWEDLRRQRLGRAHTIAETMDPDEAHVTTRLPKSFDKDVNGDMHTGSHNFKFMLKSSRL